MANVRSRFDAIGAYLGRAHGARTTRVRGRLCLGIDKATFMAVHPTGIGFRLRGRALSHALTLPGVRPWHPIDPERVAPGWVLVPSAHAWRWERLAIEALRAARIAQAQRYVREAAAGIATAAIPLPPPSTVESLVSRVRAAIARNFGGLILARAA
jgi:hypothetical protein